jgi:hypothetical protein
VKRENFVVEIKRCWWQEVTGIDVIFQEFYERLSFEVTAVAVYTSKDKNSQKLHVRSIMLGKQPDLGKPCYLHTCRQNKQRARENSVRLL